MSGKHFNRDKLWLVLSLHVLVAVVLTGCYAGKHSGVGIAVSPAIKEEYAIRGRIVDFTITENPIVGAAVAVEIGSSIVTRTKTGIDGRFYIVLGNTPDGPHPNVEPGIPIIETENQATVVHGFAAVQTHEHYTVKLSVENKCYTLMTRSLEVPVNIQEPELIFKLVQAECTD